MLKEHSEGIIALSACIAGEVPKALLRGDYDEAKKFALKYAEVLGKDNYFLEIQDHGLSEQKENNSGYVEIVRGNGYRTCCDKRYTLFEKMRTQSIRTF